MCVLEIDFVISHFSSDFCDSACCSNISYHDLAQYLREDNFLFLRSNFGGVCWAGAALQALRLIRVGGRCIFCVGLCTFGVRLLFLFSPLLFPVSLFSSATFWTESKHWPEHTTLLLFHLLPHVHILPWCVGLQCCHPGKPRQSLLVWVCIAKKKKKTGTNWCLGTRWLNLFY